jgi:hypothetical protein
MLRWLGTDFGLGPDAACVLLAQVAEYEVTNVCNPAFGMVCRVPLTDGLRGRRADGRELWSAGRPRQEDAFRAYVTDGREMVRHGATVALLGLPCRYTHSSYETVDLGDLEALVDVLAAWV